MGQIVKGIIGIEYGVKGRKNIRGRGISIDGLGPGVHTCSVYMQPVTAITTVNRKNLGNGPVRRIGPLMERRHFHQRGCALGGYQGIIGIFLVPSEFSNINSRQISAERDG